MKDEFHFLLECSLYHELRITYIKPYYWKNIDYAKLMCNEGRWFVDMSLYVCIMNVYMFDYWLHTQRHVCQRYSVINSWNSCILNWWLTINRAWTLSLLRYMVKVYGVTLCTSVITTPQVHNMAAKNKKANRINNYQ
mgnify:CR=1 FL=1